MKQRRNFFKRKKDIFKQTPAVLDMSTINMETGYGPNFFQSSGGITPYQANIAIKKASSDDSYSSDSDSSSYSEDSDKGPTPSCLFSADQIDETRKKPENIKTSQNVDENSAVAATVTQTKHKYEKK